MIRVHDIGFSYGTQRVLHNVDASFSPGELTGIIGPSGAGKTTLLRILLGELRPSTGSIEVPPGESMVIGYVPQIESGERSFPLTVEEMVMLGAASFAAPSPWFSTREKREAHGILKRLEISDLATRRLDELSGGQFQRALIARALMSRPNLLLLDEPTSGVDLKNRKQVLELIDEFADEGYTVVLTTHDINWVAAHLPKIICLNRTVLADGHPNQVLTKEVVSSTYGTEMDVLTHNGRPILVDAATRRAP